MSKLLDFLEIVLPSLKSVCKISDSTVIRE